MSFVFYDTETTGLNKGFDQIIQFAAIKTDANLNEVDSFEVRSRLLPHVIPHPKALCTNGVTIEQLNDRARMSHYDMVREIQRKLLKWSPAIFVGYNSIDFDEEMLRHALIQTLHLPYLTSNHSNGRADAMGLAMAAAAITPGSLVVPISADGRQRFRLAELAPSNEISHSGAHDAMADAIATLEICRLVRERAPGQWNQFQRFSRKATVQDFVETEDGFVFTEFFGNEAYHAPVVCVGRHPENPNGRLCLRLDGEIDRFVGMSNEELLAEISTRPSPIRVIRVNAAPTLTAIYEASEGMLSGVSADDLETRARQVKSDPLFCARLVAAYTSTYKPWPKSSYVEKQIHDGWISTPNEIRMANFHDAAWPEALSIVNSFDDERLKVFGLRLVYYGQKSTLPAELRLHVERELSNRITDHPEALTLAKALQETDALLAGEMAGAPILLGYRAYLIDRMQKVTAFRANL